MVIYCNAEGIILDCVNPASDALLGLSVINSADGRQSWVYHIRSTVRGVSVQVNGRCVVACDAAGTGTPRTCERRQTLGVVLDRILTMH